jgi:hypothetical protein
MAEGTPTYSNTHSTTGMAGAKPAR